MEIDKTPGVWCEHCDKTGPAGCLIHDQENYPLACKDFQCGYILSNLPEEYRPNKCHVIITGQENDLGCLFVHVDPAYPEAYRSKKIERLLGVIMRASDGVLNGALITIGKEFRIIAADEQAAYRLRDIIKSSREE